MNEDKLEWIKKMEVREFMEEETPEVSPEDSIEKVIDILQRKEIKILPVTDKRGYLKGKINETDVMKLFMDKQRLSSSQIFGARADFSYFAETAKDIMKKYKKTLRPKDSVPLAAKKIVDAKSNSLPVVSKNDRLVGVLHAEDLMKEVAE